jgi:hypothetical protein
VDADWGIGRQDEFFSRSITLPFSLYWVLSYLGLLDILTSSSRGLEIVRVPNHLTLQGKESLSSLLRSRLKLWVSGVEHMSSCRRHNTRSGATA